jgi:hypothetical protein
MCSVVLTRRVRATPNTAKHSHQSHSMLEAVVTVLPGFPSVSFIRERLEDYKTPFSSPLVRPSPLTCGSCLIVCRDTGNRRCPLARPPRMCRGDGRTGSTGLTGPPAKEGTSRRRVHTEVTHPAGTIIGTDNADIPEPLVGPGVLFTPEPAKPDDALDLH